MPRDPTQTLTGWKEISAHLRVTVRTAQLWEKQRGLLIHRYPGDGKPRVYETAPDGNSPEVAGAFRRPSN